MVEGVEVLWYQLGDPIFLQSSTEAVSNSHFTFIYLFILIMFSLQKTEETHNQNNATEFRKLVHKKSINRH